MQCRPGPHRSAVQHGAGPHDHVWLRLLLLEFTEELSHFAKGRPDQSDGVCQRSSAFGPVAPGAAHARPAADRRAGGPQYRAGNVRHQPVLSQSDCVIIAPRAEIKSFTTNPRSHRETQNTSKWALHETQ